MPGATQYAGAVGARRKRPTRFAIPAGSAPDRCCLITPPTDGACAAGTGEPTAPRQPLRILLAGGRLWVPKTQPLDARRRDRYRRQSAVGHFCGTCYTFLLYIDGMTTLGEP